MLILLTNLALFFLISTHIHSAVAQTPERKIAFTRWKNAAKGWERQNDTALVGIRVGFIKNSLPTKDFRFSLRAASMSYTFYAASSGTYTIRFGMYEKPTCTIGARNTKFTVNGVTTPIFDISSNVGCGNKFYLDVTFTVLADKKIVFEMKRCCGGYVPYVSNMQLFPGMPSPLPTSSTTSPSSTPTNVASTPTIVPSVTASTPTPAVSSTSMPSQTSTATPSKMATTPTPLPSDIIIDVGPDYSIPGTTAVINSGGAIDTSAVSNIPASAFSTARKGISFQVSFTLPPGVYTVRLGFVELNTAFCSPATRVFSVFINGFVRLESYDIFTAAGGCRKATSETFIDQVVDPLNPQPLTISFQGIAEDAIVSYIRVLAKNENCDPISDEVQEDHLAHAVPGIYPPNDEPAYVDTSNQGFVNVKIDGSGSHTHYANGAILGKITSYTWILPETGKVIATSAVFRRNFYLGTTRLRLIVVDNACSRDEAETTVTVTGNILSGAWCYYYNGLSDLPLGGTLQENPRPTYSARTGSLNLGFPNFPFKNSNFVARCTFFLEFKGESSNTIISVNTAGTGNARVYEGTDLIIDSLTDSASGPISTAIGLAAYEIVYRRTDLSAEPSLKLFVNGTLPAVFHDRSTVLPIITSIDPASGPVSGGSRTTISGYGLFPPLTANFGTNSALVDPDESTATLAVVFPPASSSAQVVQVTLETASGIKSASLPYEYGSTCDPIEFVSKNLTNGGKNFDFVQPTSITIWQDGKLYVGTRPGLVKVVGYNSETLEVTSYCRSPTITDSRYNDKNGNPSQRAVLGITFDPSDTVARPYIAVSSLFWDRQGGIEKSNDERWSNGAIERLKPASAATKAANPEICLEYDKNIVRYLPVADGDHSVNEILFTQNGDLIIAVGGNTNAGLPYANLGGNFDAFFSGAVLVAHLSRPGFNGEISYTTPKNLRTAMPQSDDVELYATGVRNLFSMSMTRDGSVYAADMGPNCGFGNVSSSCSEYNEAEAALRDTTNKVPFPGTAIVGVGDCKYGDYRKDKLIQVKPGKFYGHSNLIRGTRLNQPEECVWIDPLTDLSPPPASAAPPANYESPLTLLKSATTGVREYGGNLFCGKLRGDLILSIFKSRKTFRVGLNSDGSYKNGPSALKAESGIRVEESMHGDLIFPNYADSVTYFLRPKVSSKIGLFVTNAIPFRHGRGGGTLLRIGGWGFQSSSSSSSAVVSVGGKNCPVVSISETEIVCTVPPYSGGSGSVDVSVTVGVSSNTLPKAVLYMSV